MANYNKVILLGRLTADIELKQVPQGDSVTTFSIAVDRKATLNGEKKVDFISCVAWRDRAERISKYFKKGSHILIEGELQTRSWTDRAGSKHYVTEVSVISANFIDAKLKDEGISPPKPKEAPRFEEVKPNDDDLPF